MVKKYAIVGNIASGKTAVEGFFREKGFSVLDTDKVGHEILLSQNASDIIKAFEGQDILTDGVIDRKKLSEIVFSDYHSRKKLEAIVHPLIRQQIERYFAEHTSDKVVFVAVPLLFEAKMEDLFDKIIFVFADDEIRLERLMKRNNLSLPEAKRRINSQMSQFMKLEESDYVFHNNGTLESLKKQTDDFCNKIIEKET